MCASTTPAGSRRAAGKSACAIVAIVSILHCGHKDRVFRRVVAGSNIGIYLKCDVVYWGFEQPWTAFPAQPTRTCPVEKHPTSRQKRRLQSSLEESPRVVKRRIPTEADTVVMLSDVKAFTSMMPGLSRWRSQSDLSDRIEQASIKLQHLSWLFGFSRYRSQPWPVGSKSVGDGVPRHG